jgi:hypothetical protein
VLDRAHPDVDPKSVIPALEALEFATTDAILTEDSTSNLPHHQQQQHSPSPQVGSDGHDAGEGVHHRSDLMNWVHSHVHVFRNKSSHVHPLPPIVGASDEEKNAEEKENADAGERKDVELGTFEAPMCFARSQQAIPIILQLTHNNKPHERPSLEKCVSDLTKVAEVQAKLKETMQELMNDMEDSLEAQSGGWDEETGEFSSGGGSVAYSTENLAHTPSSFRSITDDEKETVWEVVLKAMEMRIETMYSRRTLSGAAFQHLIECILNANDALPTMNAGAKSKVPGKSGRDQPTKSRPQSKGFGKPVLKVPEELSRANGPSLSRRSQGWKSMRDMLANVRTSIESRGSMDAKQNFGHGNNFSWSEVFSDKQASQELNPFQLAWDKLKSSIDANVDWAVRQSHHHELFRCARSLFPTTEQGLATSVQALMGFISAIEATIKRASSPEFERVFAEDPEQVLKQLAIDTQRYDDDLSHVDHPLPTSPTSRRISMSLPPLRARSRASVSNKQQQDDFKDPGESSHKHLPVVSWVLKQLTVVKLQAYGTLAAMRLMFPAELRVIHTMLAAKVALSYMKRKVHSVCDQGLITHHTLEDILEVIKHRQDKIHRYKLRYL